MNWLTISGELFAFFKVYTHLVLYGFTNKSSYYSYLSIEGEDEDNVLLRNDEVSDVQISWQESLYMVYVKVSTDNA